MQAAEQKSCGGSETGALASETTQSAHDATRLCCPGCGMMVSGMMNGGSMMWGVGWVGLLILVLVVLGIAALAKYLFFDNRR